MLDAVASIKIHSSIGMVVFEETAFKEMFTLFSNSDFEKINFIMCITSFLEREVYESIIYKKSVVILVGPVKMCITCFYLRILILFALYNYVHPVERLCEQDVYSES